MEVKLFANLAEIAGSRSISLDNDSVGSVEEAITATVERHPGLETEIFDENGTIHDHINILHNGETIRDFGSSSSRPVNSDDEIAIFPPVSGGARRT